jgi:hypothetical protein
MCTIAHLSRRADQHFGPSRFLMALLAAFLLSASTTASIIPCAGDCSGDSAVTIDELIRLVNIALGCAQLSTCKVGDWNGDNEITIDEILTAVNVALNGCGGG